MAKRNKIPYNKPVSAQYVRTLRAKAMLGNADALEELEKRNKALARVANNRLAQLEKAGYTRYAYNRAITYTESEYGGTRFTSSRKKLQDIPDLQINIQEMSKFIDSDLSTVEGQIAVDNKIVNSFRDKGVYIPEGSEEAFLDMIASDEFETLKKCCVDSGTAVFDMIRLTGEYGVTLEDINIMWAKVVDGMRKYNTALGEIGAKYKIPLDKLYGGKVF